MSSGIRINPSSPSNLDYGSGSDDSLSENEGDETQSSKHKSYIDRSDSRNAKDTSLDKRKARKKDRRKKKKITERNTREFNEDQKEE
ncbi:hypothetical protein [Endozoicomonas sp.]|uniref:hypothetical protein n=1 Tax=Endozoicomonas sp. TaxID=1892382 RepID=UPI002884C0E7|nr:hypothetical protein [Endozoicomonas sp.]